MKWIEALTKYNTMTRRGIAIRSKLFLVLHLLQVIGSGLSFNTIVVLPLPLHHVFMLQTIPIVMTCL